MVLILALPMAFLATIFIHPFWRWFERVSGIESFGHSGPAEWCYWFDYVAIIAIGVTIIILYWKQKGRKLRE